MKKLLTILISLLLMFNLTACGKNDSIPEPEDENSRVSKEHDDEGERNKDGF